MAGIDDKYIQINPKTIRDTCPVDIYSVDNNDFVVLFDSRRGGAYDLHDSLAVCKTIYVKSSDLCTYVDYISHTLAVSLDENRGNALDQSKILHSSLECALQHAFTDTRREMITVADSIAKAGIEWLTGKDLKPYIQRVNSHNPQKYVHYANIFMLLVPFAMQSGYSNSDLHDIGMGAILHDIGETQLPKSLMNLDREFTFQERQYMEQHPFLGFHLIQQMNVGLSPKSAFMAWQHHERWDGSGYPQRLRGNNILPQSRLLSIVDTFDAMIAQKQYRKAFSPFDALKDMALTTKFKKEEVKSFVAFLGKNKILME